MRELPPISTATNEHSSKNTPTISGFWSWCSRAWDRPAPGCGITGNEDEREQYMPTSRQSARSDFQGAAWPKRRNNWRRCRARPTPCCARRWIAMTTAPIEEGDLSVIGACARTIPSCGQPTAASRSVPALPARRECGCEPRFLPAKAFRRARRGRTIAPRKSLINAPASIQRSHGIFSNPATVCCGLTSPGQAGHEALTKQNLTATKPFWRFRANVLKRLICTDLSNDAPKLARRAQTKGTINVQFIPAEYPFRRRRFRRAGYRRHRIFRFRHRGPLAAVSVLHDPPAEAAPPPVQAHPPG